MQVSNDKYTRYISDRRSLDRVRLRHLLLYMALDRTSRKHQHRQLSRRIPADTGGSREVPASAGRSAPSQEDQLIGCRSHTNPEQGASAYLRIRLIVCVVDPGDAALHRELAEVGVVNNTKGVGERRNFLKKGNIAAAFRSMK